MSHWCAGPKHVLYHNLINVIEEDKKIEMGILFCVVNYWKFLVVVTYFSVKRPSSAFELEGLL